MVVGVVYVFDVVYVYVFLCGGDVFVGLVIEYGGCVYEVFFEGLYFSDCKECGGVGGNGGVWG